MPCSEQYQRNSTDEFTGGVDWKPVQGTKLTFEEEITHFKTDSYFTLAPNSPLVQEADGTPAYLGNWDSQTAYGISGCNTASMGSAYTSATSTPSSLRRKPPAACRSSIRHAMW